MSDESLQQWRTDTQGLTLQGASGGGKTTTGRALHWTYPGPSIFFDVDEEPELGREVRSVQELHDALQEGAVAICVRTPEDVIEDPELFPEVVEYLMQVGNRLREQERGRMQFIIGEAQDVQEKYVKLAMKRFRKRRIKPVVETQDPFSLSTRIRTQAAYNAWVSPPKNKQKESLETTRWPVELLEELDEHQVAVFGAGWEPVARMKAGAEYAVE